MRLGIGWCIRYPGLASRAAKMPSLRNFIALSNVSRILLGLKDLIGFARYKIYQVFKT